MSVCNLSFLSIFATSCSNTLIQLADDKMTTRSGVNSFSLWRLIQALILQLFIVCFSNKPSYLLSHSCWLIDVPHAPISALPICLSQGLKK